MLNFIMKNRSRKVVKIATIEYSKLYFNKRVAYYQKITSLNRVSKDCIF